jgi:hypothetical protein
VNDAKVVAVRGLSGVKKVLGLALNKRHFIGAVNLGHARLAERNNFRGHNKNRIFRKIR